MFKFSSRLCRFDICANGKAHGEKGRHPVGRDAGVRSIEPLLAGTAEVRSRFQTLTSPMLIANRLRSPLP